MRPTMKPFIAVIAASSHDMLLVAWLGRIALEAVAPAVDELLDGEQRDEKPRERDRGIERGERRHRRHAEIAQALDDVYAAEIHHAEGGEEHDAAVEDLGDQTGAPVHRFGDRGEIEMIGAPDRHAGADEDAVDEEG